MKKSSFKILLKKLTVQSKVIRSSMLNKLHEPAPLISQSGRTKYSYALYIHSLNVAAVSWLTIIE